MNNVDFPNSPETEQAVIGAIILEKEMLESVAELLNPDCFYELAHKIIFETIEEMHRAGEKTDILTVKTKLERSDKLKTIGGAYYLSQLTMKIGSGAHIVEHSRILYELYMRRQLVFTAISLHSKAANLNNDIFEVVEATQNELLKLTNFDETKVEKINVVMEDVFRIIAVNQKSESEITGLRTGLTLYDEFTGGFQKTDLVVIAGETSQGKTALALTMVGAAAAKFGAKAAIYSLEMSNIQLCARLAAQEAGISAKELLTIKHEKEFIRYLDLKTQKLSSSDIFFDNSATTNLESILRSIRSMKKRYDVDIAVVDYLQLVSTVGNSREQEVAKTARAFKNAAKDLNITVVALSQLSRSNDPKPNLRRLRDSGQIEEAADQIVFVYRPETYRLEYPDPFDSYDPRGTALIDIAKGRNIGTRQFIADFDARITLFSDYKGSDRYVTENKIDW